MREGHTGKEFTVEQIKREFERIRPVALIVTERRENGEYADRISTYDRFMRDYVGDLSAAEEDGVSRYGDIRRVHPGFGEINYDQHYLSSYSQAGHFHLVHVRKASALPGTEKQAFFAVTADMVTGEITEWRINDVSYDGEGSTLTQKLSLSKRSLRGLDAEPEIDSGEIDPFKALAGYVQRLTDYETQQRLAPAIELSAQGCWFNVPGGELMPLAPIVELQRKLEIYDTYYKDSHDEHLKTASLLGTAALPRQLTAVESAAADARTLAAINKLP